jgi:arylsulfatase A-like enzyme
MAHACDWAPTLLELCGIEPAVENLDGQSLVKLLHNGEAASPHEALHWDLGGQWAVRRGPWKLIHKVRATAGPKLGEEDREWFLANLDEDPSEKKNYAGLKMEIVKQLQRSHKKMRTEE